MRLKGICEALLDGCELRMIATVDGLIICVVTKNDQPKGYWEDRNINHVLSRAERDMRATDAPTDNIGADVGFEVGEFAPLCARLEEWLRAGNTLVASGERDTIVARLYGVHTVRVPCVVLGEVMDTRSAVTWKHRGYTYVTAPDPERPMAGCIVSNVIERPAGSKEDADWKYPVFKLGFGERLLEAVDNAFMGQEHEIVY